MPRDTVFGKISTGSCARASGLAVQGWRKSLSPTACEWCQEVAGDTYFDPDSVPFHPGDVCGVEPALDDEQASVDDSAMSF